MQQTMETHHARIQPDDALAELEKAASATAQAAQDE